MTARLGGDDRDLVGPDLDVAQQQRQDALADAAESNNDESAGKGCVFLVGHRARRAVGEGRSGTVALRQCQGDPAQYTGAKEPMPAY